MKVLIAYGSTEGQTRKIAGWIAERLLNLGNEVVLFDSISLLKGLDVTVFDAFIVAASVHQEIHQKHVSAFVSAHKTQLEMRPSAFISVSLSAALDEAKHEAQRYVDFFIEKTGWQPTATHLAAGAIRNSEYDFFKQYFVRFVVLKSSAPTETEKDYELTDWQALASFVDTFISEIEVN